MHGTGVLDGPGLENSLAHFALDGLRYFSKYDSEALRPYIIFMVYAYKAYGQHGYLSFHPETGRLVLDPSKTLAVLDTFSECFERVLAAEDASDGTALEKILYGEMSPEDEFVRSVLGLMNAAKSSGGGCDERPERNCTCHPTWSIPLCLECQA
jgi:hypothetical protein